MATPSYKHLSADQAEQFLSRGHVVIQDCFSREFAEEWKARAFIRLGLDAAKPETWPSSRIHMPSLEYVEVKEVAPRAWGAMCDLCGGEDRIQQPARWGDSFILNLNDGADRLWAPHRPGRRDGIKTETFSGIFWTLRSKGSWSS